MGSTVGTIAADIRSSARGLEPGARLPTSRELIARYRVSAITVARALAVLRAEGVVATRPGSGTYVAERAAVPARDLDTSWQSVALGDRVINATWLQAALEEATPGAISLAGGYLHHSLMPSQALALAVQRALRRPDIWERAPTSGLPALRAWFADHVGGGTSADDVLITSGGQSAISAVLRALVP